MEKIAKPVLPATHTQLARAIKREARNYHRHQAELEQAARRDVEPPTDAKIAAADVDQAPSEDLVDHKEPDPEQ